MILRSLRYHWRMNLAVACGVGVGAAVLTGALLVGDSMRGSLRQLTLDRLGRIDEALVADRFFRQELAGELAGSERPGATAGSSSSAESTGGQATRGTHQEQVRPPILSDGGPPDAGHGAIAVAPAILLRASLEKADSQPPVRANQVNLVGCDERFWQLGHGGPRRRPRPNEIVLNAPLAQCLAVAEGDAVVLRLPRPGAIPAESVLGRKQQTVRSLRLRVREVLPAEGLGKFGLRPTQRLPRNAYVSLGEIQEQLAQPGRINAILVAGRAKWQTADGGNPPAADYGIHVEQTPRGYVNIWSERMLLEPAAETAMLEALAGAACQPALTYLANSIACGGRSIPYSTVTALDFAAGPPLGPMLSPEGRPVPPLADDQIALNTWAADDLGAKLGDQIDLSYFEPESAHGVPQEKTVRLRLAAVVQLAGAAADPALTPAVPGITDRLSLSGWDPPFPFDARRVRPKDDRYWHDHRATPKAFVSLATGRRLWASRFGQSTSLRVGDCPNFRPPVPSDRPKMGLSPSTVETFKDRLRIDPAAMGLVFQPVKQQGLDAAAGTTPFGVLFLLFSSFVIAAAAMLMAILFRLGVDGRAAEAGILLALGFRPRKVAGLLTAEGLLVAALGSLLGMGAGIGYAALMLAGLRTWWLAAVSTPLLRLYVEPLSLAIGPAAAAAIAAITMFFSARRVSRVPPRRLLAGVVASAIDGRRTTDDGRRARALPSVVRPPSSVPSGQSPVARRPSPRHPSTRPIVVDALLLGVALAPAVLLLAVPLGEEARVGAFFGAGALALGALLGLAYRRLRAGATGPAVAPGRGNLLRMALRGAARNPGRSTLSAGLTAAACFLIVATSAFRLDPASQARHGTSGSGGFALVAESDQPIYHDLGTPAGRAELGFSRADERLLAACMVFAFRVKPGDDASCLNLYQPRQPRLLGLPRPFLEQAVFAWADRPPGKENPWLALESINGQGPDAQDAETRRRGDAGTRRQADKQTRRQGDKESSDVSLVPASP
ncbi:MAG: ABC transporter permease, partial [Thermoguttaceae bacterium]